MRKFIVTKIIEFEPSAIMVSAGFDIHRNDRINNGFIGLYEKDFEFIAQSMMTVKDVLDNSPAYKDNNVRVKIISVLEGGYNIRGENMSPFIKSNEF
jgi:acetoin utilization deacetylase AcuC-like enzyme